MRALLNRLRRRLVRALLFRTVFGERCAATGRWLPDTRISASTCIDFEQRLVLGDGVFIGHFCWIEASGGVHIGAGTQITHYVSILTHSTHRSVRLQSGAANVHAPVHIGQRCFIGPHSTLEAGASLGHGCVVAAHSRVRGQFADFSLIGGSPAQVLGDVRTADERWLAQHPEARAAYDAWRASLPQEAA